MRLVCLLTSLAIALSAAPAAIAAPTAGLGALFPGAKLVAPPVTQSCRMRYKFDTNASLDTVAAFYLAQGRSTHLPLVGDRKVAGAGFRIIVFKDAAGRYLSVVLNARSTGVTGSIETVRTPGPACK